MSLVHCVMIETGCFYILVRTVYPTKYAHGFVVLCFVVVMQSFIMNSQELFIHIHQGCFAGTGAIVRLPQCQWSKPDGYGKISQCITTTKHSKAKTVCIFLGIYCIKFVLWSAVYYRQWFLMNNYRIPMPKCIQHFDVALNLFLLPCHDLDSIRLETMLYLRNVIICFVSRSKTKFWILDKNVVDGAQWPAINWQIQYCCNG